MANRSEQECFDSLRISENSLALVCYEILNHRSCLDNNAFPISLLSKKYNSDYPLQGIMRQEHVTLQNVEITQLYDLIKKYLQQLKLDIIHVEVMIRGNEGNYDLILLYWCVGQGHYRSNSNSGCSDCRSSCNSCSCSVRL